MRIDNNNKLRPHNNKSTYKQHKDTETNVFLTMLIQLSTFTDPIIITKPIKKQLPSSNLNSSSHKTTPFPNFLYSIIINLHDNIKEFIK